MSSVDCAVDLTAVSDDVDMEEESKVIDLTLLPDSDDDDVVVLDLEFHATARNNAARTSWLNSATSSSTPPTVWSSHSSSSVITFTTPWMEVGEGSQVPNIGQLSTINKKITGLGTKPAHSASPKWTPPKQPLDGSPEIEFVSPSRRKYPLNHSPDSEPPFHHDPGPSKKKTVIHDQLQTASTSYSQNPTPKIELKPEILSTFDGSSWRIKAEPDCKDEYDLRNFLGGSVDDGLGDYRPKIESYGFAESYDCIHAGYDIQDESRWKVLLPPPVIKNEVNMDGILPDHGTSSPKQKLPRREILFTTRRGKVVRPTGGQFVWELLGDVQKRVSAGRCRQKPFKSARDPEEYGKRRYNGGAMRKEASFKIAPGAINRIEQHSGWLAIGASRTGGQADELDEENRNLEPYNDPGSLLTWNGQCHILSGHTRAVPTGKTDINGEEVYRDKYYTVNDIKFNNSGRCFVSVGMDKRAQFWTREEEGFSEDSTFGNNLDEYDRVPYEVAFQPSDGESNVVAVGARNIYVYPDVNHDAHLTKTTLILASRTQHTHNSGAMRWDLNNPHILYASSEPGNDVMDGVHKAFDLNEGRKWGTVVFDANEAGDAMAINTDVLALATRGVNKNYLRLFDVKRLAPHPAQEIELEPFSGGTSDLEVSCMTFSPDGLYLALARSDNRIHIYDSRMLGRGILHDYQHMDQDPVFSPPGSSFYGVAHVQWIVKRNGQYVLLSGGDDGCVRLWNPTWSAKEPTNGQIIVEVSRDIGVFSVGDPFRGEHDLVVGDSSGEVTTFSGLLNFL